MEAKTGVNTPEDNISNLRSFLESHMGIPGATVRYDPGEKIFNVDINELKNGHFRLLVLNGNADAKELLGLAKKAGGLNYEVNVRNIDNATITSLTTNNVDPKLVKLLGLD